MKPFKIGVFFSGLERSLVGQKYNMRVDEVKSAAYALLAYAGADYGKFCETFMRDIPEELFTRYGDRLPETWRRRAIHYFGEMRRVEEAVAAWQKCDIAEFGRVSFESGRSSIEYWETGSEELKAMYEIMLETDGIYGGRFSGAGFKGCCMAIIDPAYEESICQRVTEKYLKRFPELSEKYRCCVCDTADGAL
jgi:galactokinase/galacturonokinase